MLAATAWRDAESSFSGKQGDTVTVRTDTVVGEARTFNRAANRPTVVDDVKEVGVDVKLNTYLYKGINLPDEQLTLNVRDFTSQIATPQAKSVARGEITERTHRRTHPYVLVVERAVAADDRIMRTLRPSRKPGSRRIGWFRVDQPRHLDSWRGSAT